MQESRMSETYKTSVVIVDDRGQVVAHQSPAGLALPEVSVEPGRVGISLSKAVRDQLHLETFCLVLPEPTAGSLHILRLQRSDAALPAAHVWTDPTSLPDLKVTESLE